MNIDLKLKTYEQLQNEVITSNTNSYLKDLKIKQLQSNWNSLREWLENSTKQDAFMYNFTAIKVSEILDKMNELEGVDNENN